MRSSPAASLRKTQHAEDAVSVAVCRAGHQRESEFDGRNLAVRHAAMRHDGDCRESPESEPVRPPPKCVEGRLPSRRLRDYRGEIGSAGLFRVILATCLKKRRWQRSLGRFLRCIVGRLEYGRHCGARGNCGSCCPAGAPWGGIIRIRRNLHGDSGRLPAPLGPIWRSGHENENIPSRLRRSTGS